MRSAEQVGRTVEEWHEYQRAERRRTLDALIRELEAARRRGDEWYRWIDQGCPRLTVEEYEARHPERARGARRGRRRLSA